MSNNILQKSGLNAIIVGSGAIGSALAESLLQRENLGQLVILRRSSDVHFSDSRVTVFTFDAENPESLTAAANSVHKSMRRTHLMINTVGLLHSEKQQPEKQLSRLETSNLQRSFVINAMLLPVLVQKFGGLLRHQEGAVFASLSARVGSIGDNQLGGWYSYRASKAAHNMLLRTIAQEWRMSHRNAAIVALHPGTVHSRLSEPFISPGYKNRVHTPAECSGHLLSVLGTLTPKSSGRFLDWEGKAVPW